MASGAYESVLKLSESFAVRFPLEVAAPLLEAKASIKLRQDKRAQSAIDKAAAMSPIDTEPDVLLSELREAQGDLPSALEAVGRAVKKRPNSTGLTARRGYLLSQSGRLDEAAEVLSNVLLKKFDPDAAAELSFVRLRQNDTAEALALLKRALKKEPRLAKAHYYMGMILSRQGDLKGAERSYREADELSPNDPKALGALCELHSRSGHANEVREIRQLIATRFPRDSALQTRCSP
jgi:Flp pilus assembly protein TadD